MRQKRGAIVDFNTEHAVLGQHTPGTGRAGECMIGKVSCPITARLAPEDASMRRPDALRPDLAAAAA